MYTDEEKLQLRKMLSTPGWKILESIVQKRIEEFEKQIDVSARDFRNIREKKYDDLNLNGALVWGMSLVLKAPYDVLNEEAENNLINKMNEHWGNEIKKLER